MRIIDTRPTSPVTTYTDLHDLPPGSVFLLDGVPHIKTDVSRHTRALVFWDSCSAMFIRLDLPDTTRRVPVVNLKTGNIYLVGNLSIAHDDLLPEATVLLGGSRSLG